MQVPYVQVEQRCAQRATLAYYAFRCVVNLGKPTSLLPPEHYPGPDNGATTVIFVPQIFLESRTWGFIPGVSAAKVRTRAFRPEPSTAEYQSPSRTTLILILTETCGAYACGRGRGRGRKPYMPISFLNPLPVPLVVVGFLLLTHAGLCCEPLC